MQNISHNKPFLADIDCSDIVNVIKSGFVSYGEQSKCFENELCKFLGLPEGHAVVTTSGSSALYLALNALNAEGKTVAVPSYVCSSLRNAVSFAKGKIKYIDIEHNYPNININELNKIKPDIAIIPHMFGIPVDLDKINKEITVIEDCAQSIGGGYKGTMVGTYGTIGIFSFYATKLMTTGEGGAIVSKSKEIINKVRDFIDFDCRYDNKIRFNFHMSDINAALGRLQLKLLPEFIKRREKIFNIYKTTGLTFIEPNISTVKPVRYRVVLKTNKQNELKKLLLQKGISSIIPIEEGELLYPSSNAVKLANNSLSIPCYPALTDEQVMYIKEKLEEIC